MKQSSKVADLFIRYLIILLLGIGNLYLFYKILTPATIYAASAILRIFTNPRIFGNMILMKQAAIEIIPACVAGSAFYLLFILLMATPDIKIKKRLLILVTSFIILFLLNIFRILLLIPLASTQYFDAIHWIFWNLISTIFVVAIWISMVKLFNIKRIPIYSDVKFLSGFLKKRKNPKRSKKH